MFDVISKIPYILAGPCGDRSDMSRTNRDVRFARRNQSNMTYCFAFSCSMILASSLTSHQGASCIESEIKKNLTNRKG